MGTSANPSHHRAETFGRDDREVARARAFVGDVLRAWDVAGPVIADLRLVASELVANALLHGSGTIGVDLALHGGAVRMDVRDGGGPSVPRLRASVPVGGWGLRLVDRLVDRWGFDHDPDCTVVWIERDVTRSGGSPGVPGPVPARGAASTAPSTSTGIVPPHLGTDLFVVRSADREPGEGSGSSRRG